MNFYQPQVQIKSGQWIDVGVKTTELKDAETQREVYIIHDKIIAWRIVCVSDAKSSSKRGCCGGAE